MCSAIEADVWSDQRARPDADFASIENDTIKVDKDVLTQLDVETVVYVHGAFDPRFVLE